MSSTLFNYNFKPVGDLPISQRLILSLYDRSEVWPKYYIQAGYPVLLWDLSHEGCIIKRWCTLMDNLEEAVQAGYMPYGLLAAPPCTAIAAVGAKHWKFKDLPRDNYASFSGTEYFDCELDEAQVMIMAAVEIKAMMEHFAGHMLKFWALENPRGRMDTLFPELAPYRRMKFNPCDFGDPYYKETWLWGQFNENLPLNPVTVPTDRKPHRKAGTHSIDLHYGIQSKLKFKDMAQYRNRTPNGFAKAFFEANP